MTLLGSRIALAVGLLALPSGGPSVLSGVPASSSKELILPNSNRTPAGRLQAGVLTLRLELRTGTLRPHADDGPGVEVQAFAEAGRPLQIPGPLIRVPEGTVIQATIRNRLRDSTLVLHGFSARPGAPSDAIQVPPGATRSVRFSAGRAGTYYYWGTTTGKQMEDDRWIDSQLYGGLIVDPVGTRPSASDRIFIMGLWFKPPDSAAADPGGEFMVINGKSWPETERLDYVVGDTVRWRWLNPTSSSHPMHLHGFYYEVESRGSWATDTVYTPADRRTVVTELMPPGGTMTTQWTPSRAGNWLFHCHFAFHIADAQAMSTPMSDGATHHMTGLVLGIRVRQTPGVATPASAPVSPRGSADTARLRLLVRSARAPADSAHIMAYARQEGDREPAPDSASVPGPTLVLERGRPARITVVNRLAEPTAVHWHGIELKSFPDGVPEWSGTPDHLFHAIAPGDSFAAEFTPPRAGTFIYHAHANELTQIMGGLYGALIVVERGTTYDTATNRLVIVGALERHDSAFGVVNGRLDPAPIELRVGRTYRFRLINIGDARTFFALRRLSADSSIVPWRAVAKDGADLPASHAVERSDRLLTGPGETADFEFAPTATGELSLELDSPFVPWRLLVPVRIQP